MGIYKGVCLQPEHLTRMRAVIYILLLAVAAAQEVLNNPVVNDAVMVDEPEQLVNEPADAGQEQMMDMDTVGGANDIIPEPSGSSRFLRQAEVNRAWPNAIIPISFSSSFPSAYKASVNAGMARWEKHTCVRFQRQDTTSKNRVVIVGGSSCQSSVGRVGGAQTLILGSGCNGMSTTAHELGHTLGLQHTQTRSDRDSYVSLQSSNISPDMFDLNFKIERSAQSLGVPYDITSLMHYDAYAMALDKGRATIIPRERFAEYAEVMSNIEPSFYDYMMVNKMYNCDKKCTGARLTCRNNGVVDVNDCSKCFCPFGWGGQYCDQNPAGSQVLTASSSWQTLSATIGNPSDPTQPEYQYKHFVINARAGQRVELKIDYLWSGGCEYGGLEIAEKQDTRFSPPRACGMSKKNLYTSYNNRMYVRAHNRYNQLKMDVSYRSV